MAATADGERAGEISDRGSKLVFSQDLYTKASGALAPVSAGGSRLLVRMQCTP